MLKDYSLDLLAYVPLMTVVMVMFFILFVVVILKTFKLKNEFIDFASHLPIEDDQLIRIREEGDLNGK